MLEQIFLLHQVGFEGREIFGVDVAAVRKDLVTYLDDFAKNERPFPSPARPLARTPNSGKARSWGITKS